VRRPRPNQISIPKRVRSRGARWDQSRGSVTGYDHLYDCGCSVIPEAWGLPASTTLMGLGKRLAKQLVEQSGRISYTSRIFY